MCWVIQSSRSSTVLNTSVRCCSRPILLYRTAQSLCSGICPDPHVQTQAWVSRCVHRSRRRPVLLWLLVFDCIGLVLLVLSLCLRSFWWMFLSVKLGRLSRSWWVSWTQGSSRTATPRPNTTAPWPQLFTAHTLCWGPTPRWGRFCWTKAWSTPSSAWVAICECALPSVRSA